MTDDSPQANPQKWPEGTKFAAGFVLLSGYVLLMGEFGLNLASWQLQLFGTPETQMTLLAAWLPIVFAPGIVAFMVMVIRGDFNDE